MITLTKSSLVLCCCLLAGARTQDYDYQDQRQDQRPQAAGRFISQSNDIKPTPVPILKQINRHNEDGSYTYGYEGADGSFKIETKSAGGAVKGKYGYKDETGKVRVVEYGADQYGFQPAGEGITVAPPTLVDESALEERRQQQQQNQHQHQQQPQQHHQQPQRPKPQQQQQQAYRAPARPAYQPQQDFAQYDEPAPAPRPAHRQSFSAPSPPRPSFFAGAAAAPAHAAPARAEQPFFRPEPRAQQFQQYQAPSSKPAFEYTQALQFQSKNNNNNNNYDQQQQYNNPQPAPVRPAEDRPYVAKPQRHNNQGSSTLDQLIQEYGLPQGQSAPLHDITFGSY